MTTRPWRRLVALLLKRKRGVGEKPGRHAAQSEVKRHPQDTREREVQPEADERSMLVDMTRELGELRAKLATYRPLSDEVLTRFLSLVQLHTEGLSAAVDQYGQIIGEVNEEWGPEDGYIGADDGS